MMTPEHVFNTVQISLLVPEESVQLPVDATSSSESWLSELSSLTDRKLAFFDERLLAYFLVQVPFDGPDENGLAPIELLTFLTHLQISLDASYISPIHQEASPAPAPSAGRLLGPPPAGRAKPRGNSPTGSTVKQRPPPLVPPHTPNPMPQVAESDAKYAAAEGVQLLSYIWGDPNSADTERKEEFALGWSGSGKEWNAMYRLEVPVVFLRTRVPDPLLALTVSVTLRDRPLLQSPARSAIYRLLEGRTDTNAGESGPATAPNGIKAAGWDDKSDSLQEINLLGGLKDAPSFSEAESALDLPTTRIGTFIRRHAYSLPPIKRQNALLTSTPSSTRALIPTLRKSYRKTLATVSGFRVRMRTLFVPYVFMSGAEEREAGNEERSVVLCVEVENSGESGTGFSVEHVEVTVGGEGATSRLIGWGAGFEENPEKSTFPLQLGSVEQCNLLYVVSFLHPDANDLLLSRTGAKTAATAPAPAPADRQRSVAIVVKGRPCEISPDKKVLSYPTEPFLSRWNCLLDLSSSRQQEMQDYTLDVPLSAQDALPTPASPFPAASPKSQGAFEKAHPISSIQGPAIAGSKRHTIAGLVNSKHKGAVPPGLGSRPSSMPYPLQSAYDSPKFTPTLPSIAVNSPLAVPQPTTAYPPSPGGGGSGYLHSPLTPAFPAYPPEVQAIPYTPYAQAPYSSYGGGSPGGLVEPHRERQFGSVGSTAPVTPGPRAFGTSFSERLIRLEPYADPVVVSVALLSPVRGSVYDEDGFAVVGGGKHPCLGEEDRIYPLDVFALEIFVFNQSPVTRRFEVGFPDRKRMRAERRSLAAAMLAGVGGDAQHKIVGDAISRLGSQAGIMPLENRIRVGPLKPETCQSVRMQFLALRPGLHSVDTLTIMDTEAEYTLNLRSVMDVVVHEPHCP